MAICMNQFVQRKRPCTTKHKNIEFINDIGNITCSALELALDWRSAQGIAFKVPCRLRRDKIPRSVFAISLHTFNDVLPYENDVLRSFCHPQRIKSAFAEPLSAFNLFRSFDILAPHGIA